MSGVSEFLNTLFSFVENFLFRAVFWSLLFFLRFLSFSSFFSFSSRRLFPLPFLSVGYCSGVSWTAFYDQFMPFFKQFIGTCSGPFSRSLCFRPFLGLLCWLGPGVNFVFCPFSFSFPFGGIFFLSCLRPFCLIPIFVFVFFLFCGALFRICSSNLVWSPFSGSFL